MYQLRPFRIEFTPRGVDDLRRRLAATRWPDVGWNTGWSTGTNDAVLRDLVAYWSRDYDWFQWQARLNQRSHVRGPDADGEIHAMVELGPAGQFPILLLHGWPSSFVEHLESSQRLAEAGFDVIVPSLPGFAFSEPARAPGMSPERIADRLHEFMQELGYQHYGVQGGDWGAIIGSALARQHPESVAGLHINFALASPIPPGTDPSGEEQAFLQFRERFESEDTGYSWLQRTRPQTVGYALNDSPVGLLAWILEKFWAWTDHGDDLWETIDRDHLLTNVTIYWLTGAITSAARLYQERVRGGPPAPRVEVPTGYARYSAEPWGPPRSMVERAYRVVHYAEMPEGGHFPAMEQPAAFASDVASFFRSIA
ncbi:MAG: epoxide hydrolase [Chloroflexi bacterium]|nr:epoxide hydrolase [Chloroflexota bacterium]MQC25488.1 epoxide hydrolase [Chloroflexota bacterium]